MGQPSDPVPSSAVARGRGGTEENQKRNAPASLGTLAALSAGAAIPA